MRRHAELKVVSRTEETEVCGCSGQGGGVAPVGSPPTLLIWASGSGVTHTPHTSVLTAWQGATMRDGREAMRLPRHESQTLHLTCVLGMYSLYVFWMRLTEAFLVGVQSTTCFSKACRCQQPPPVLHTRCVRSGPHAPLNKASPEDRAPRRYPHGLGDTGAWGHASCPQCLSVVCC